MIYIDEPEPNLLVSKMKHFGDDTRPADVVTFDPQKHNDLPCDKMATTQHARTHIKTEPDIPPNCVSKLL